MVALENRSKSVPRKDGAKIKNMSYGYDFDNSLAAEIKKNHEKTVEAERLEAEKSQAAKKLLTKKDDNLTELMNKIDKKLDSAKAKYVPKFGASAKASEF